MYLGWLRHSHLSCYPRNELKKQEMAEALHREVEELKGVLDAGFAFMEASKVWMGVCGCVGVCMFETQ